jgi:hypothetical protein
VTLILSRSDVFDLLCYPGDRSATALQDVAAAVAVHERASAAWRGMAVALDA